MADNSETARDLALNTTGRYVGVVYANFPTGRVWRAFPFRSEAELRGWFGDWSGTPDLYLHLAGYDKETPAWADGGAPILLAPDAVSGASGVTASGDRASAGLCDRLSRLIAAHEVAFGALGQRNPHSPSVRSFVQDHWDPFYAEWIELVTNHALSDVDVDVLADESRKLAALRVLAQQLGFPVPDLDEKGSPMTTKVSGRGGYRGGARPPVHAAPYGGGYHGGGYHGGYGGGFGGYHHPGGFHGRGGFYRHGSAYPGRWWYGSDGPVWIESDMNLLTEDQADPSLDSLPPPSTDDVPIDDDAKGEPPADRQVQAPDSDATGDATDAPAPAVASGWVSGRRNAAAAPAGSRLTDVASVLAPQARTVDLSFGLDGNTLCVTAKLDGQTYTAAADLAPMFAAIEPRIAAYHAELHARGHALSGCSVGRWPHEGGGYLPLSANPYQNHAGPWEPLAGQPGAFAAVLMGAGVAVSGGCGTRTYGNVTPQVIRAILNGLHDRGADVTGNNPWYAVTHDHGVEFRGTWDQAKATLAIEVTDSDFYVPCSKVWEAIEPMLADQGAVSVASLDRELGQVNEAIRATSQALVAGLLDHHCGVYCGGWFDSITNAIGDAAKGVVKGVSSAAKAAVGTVGHTLVKLKGPIAIAAGAAAATGALAIPGVGPLVAPMAGSLASSLVNAAAGSGDGAQAAQQAVQSAVQSAQTDPTVAKALAIAQKSAAQATAAYHVTQTAANAAAGSQDAAQQLTDLATAAASGDQGAQKALQIATDATDAAVDSAQQTQAAVSGAIAAPQGPRAQAIAAAKEAAGDVIGVVQRSDGTWALQTFDSSDDADDWFGQWLGLPHAYLYVAYFDKRDPAFPGPLNEQVSKRAFTPHGAAVAGWFAPLFAGLAGFGAGYFGPDVYHWAKGKWDAHKANAAHA